MMDIFGRCDNADPQDIEDWNRHMDARHREQRDQLREALELVLFCDKEDTVYARTKARAALKATEEDV